MKILVTGATSGLGRNATEWLLKQGHQVHATGRDQSVGTLLKEQGAVFTQLDLASSSDQELQRLLKDCDAVWHCAALSSPWGSYEDFYKINTLATQKLAYFAGELQIKKFIYISSPSIYFNFQSQRNISEQFLPTKFANHYAKTKYEAEVQIQQLVAKYPSTTFVTLRPRGIFGPYDRVIIPRILSQIKQHNGTLHLPSGGNALLDLTFVLNVVHAMNVATQNENLTSGKAFNITNQEPAQLKTVLNLLFKDQLNIQYKIKALPYSLLYGIASAQELIAHFNKKEPQLTRYSAGVLHYDMTLDQKNAKTILNYKPIYSLNDGIEITAKWFKSDQGHTHG